MAEEELDDALEESLGEENSLDDAHSSCEEGSSSSVKPAAAPRGRTTDARDKYDKQLPIPSITASKLSATATPILQRI